jgi:hypothetical protein
MVAMTGSDLVLSWSRPLFDIYDRTTTVVGYKVYRGTGPNFQVSDASLLATLGSGATTIYTHVGGAALPGSGFYLVTAIDASGLVSGAGRELPNGVADLSMTFTAPSTIHMSWSPVMTDLQGLPTLVHHYQIHATSVPVGRGSLGPATLLMDNVTANSIDLAQPTSPRFISVLTVDNRGNLSPF